MWPEEIKWTINQLNVHLAKESKTCLDIGSESIEYRTKYQPWNQEFYDYLKSRGIQVKTMDMDKHANPDYLHDITNPIDGHFDLVIATHLLEHVPILSLGKVAENIEQLVNKNGLLMVSIPQIYPYHAMPIDNGWRPIPKELVKIFHGEVLATATIETEHKLGKYEGLPKSKSSCALIRY